MEAEDEGYILQTLSSQMLKRSTTFADSNKGLYGINCNTRHLIIGKKKTSNVDQRQNAWISNTLTNRYKSIDAKCALILFQERLSSSHVLDHKFPSFLLLPLPLGQLCAPLSNFHVWPNCFLWRKIDHIHLCHI